MFLIASFIANADTQGDLFNNSLIVYHPSINISQENSTYKAVAEVFGTGTALFDPVDKSTHFDGDVKLKFPNIQAYNTGLNVSGFCWGNSTTGTGAVFNIMGRRVNDANGEWQFQISDVAGDDLLGFVWWDAGGAHVMSTSLSNLGVIDKYQLFGFTLTQNSTSLQTAITYVNSTKIQTSTSASSRAFVSTPLSIADNGLDDEAQYYVGGLKGCIIINKTMTDEEIAFYYQQGENFKLTEIAEVANVAPVITVELPTNNSMTNKTLTNLTYKASCFDVNGANFTIKMTNMSGNQFFQDSDIVRDSTDNLNLSGTIDLTNININNYNINYSCTDNASLSDEKDLIVSIVNSLPDLELPNITSATINNTSPFQFNIVKYSITCVDNLQVKNIFFADNRTGTFSNRSQILNINQMSFSYTTNETVFNSTGNKIAGYFQCYDSFGNSRNSAFLNYTVQQNISCSYSCNSRTTTCNSNNVKSICTSATEVNGCGVPYSGDFSEFGSTGCFGIETTLSETGNGIGVMVDALRQPVGRFILLLSVISAVIVFIFAFIYAIKNLVNKLL